MKVIDWVVEQYYKIPKLKIRFSYFIEKRDDRSFEWYLQRKELGFDETDLWDLSNRIILEANRIYGVSRELDTFERPKYNVSYVTIFRDMLNGNHERPLAIAKFCLPRIETYIEWDCPFTVWKRIPIGHDPDACLGLEDLKPEIDRSISAVRKYIETQEIDREGIDTFLLYLKHYGW